MGDIFLDHADPRLLEGSHRGRPWDVQQGNGAWIGMIGYESWHLGMMSHGAEFAGGDHDVGVMWEPEPAPGEFFTNQEFYALPAQLPGRMTSTTGSGPSTPRTAPSTTCGWAGT